MVVDYLNKTKESFLRQRTEISEKIASLENELKENIQFVQMPEEANDSHYEAFTPREVNSFNRTKISELLEERENIYQEISRLQNELNETDGRIYEIKSVIKVAKENNANTAMDDFDSNMKLTLLETVEKERQRIASELHDSTIQNLTSLVHKSELCTKLLDVDPIRCRLELFAINKTIRDIVEDTRRLIYDVRPMSFDDIGFEVTLDRILDKFRTQNNIRFNFQIQGNPYEINHLIQITLIRVIQEVCNNTVRHSEASKLDVTLSYEEKQLVLTMIDDGKGFDVKVADEEYGNDNAQFGLSIMRERVYLLSGKIDIQSKTGKGCTTIVTIPVGKEED